MSAKFIEIAKYDDQGYTSELGQKMLRIARLAGGKAETHRAGFEQEFERVCFGDYVTDEDEVEWLDWLQKSSKPGVTNKSLARKFLSEILAND